MGFFGKDDKKAVANLKKASEDLRKVEKKIGRRGVDEDSKLGKDYQAANDKVRDAEKSVSGWRRHHLFGN